MLRVPAEQSFHPRGYTFFPSLACQDVAQVLTPCFYMRRPQGGAERRQNQAYSFIWSGWFIAQPGSGREEEAFFLEKDSSESNSLVAPSGSRPASSLPPAGKR